MATNKEKLKALLITGKFLKDERLTDNSGRTEFLCLAVERAASELGIKGAGEELGIEIEKVLLEGQHHLQAFLNDKLGISYKEMIPGVLQPIRRGMLDKLIAKYTGISG